MRLPATALACLCLAVPASAQAAGALTPERFTALERVFVAAVAAEKEETIEGLAPLRAACAALPRTDAFLAAQRAACLAEYDALVALEALGKCGDEDARCIVNATERMARRLDIGRQRARTANSAVARSVRGASCATLLRASKGDLAVSQNLSRALRRLARAIRVRDEQDIDRRTKEFVRAIERYADTDGPSGATLLKQFRSRCR